MKFTPEDANLVFPTGRLIADVYDDATKRAQERSIPLWQALDDESRANGMDVGWHAALSDLRDQKLIEEAVAERGIPQLVHSLGIEVSARYFLSGGKGFGDPDSVITVSEPLSISVGAQLGFRPLVIISLTAEGSGARGVQFVPYQECMDVGPTLRRLWSSCDALLGLPDVIKLSNHLSDIEERLANFVGNESVSIQIVDGKDRRHTSNVTAARVPYFMINEDERPSLAACNQGLLDVYQDIRDNKERRVEYKKLLKRPRIACDIAPGSVAISSTILRSPKVRDSDINTIEKSGKNYGNIPYFEVRRKEFSALQRELIRDDWWFLGLLKSLPYSASTIAKLLGTSTERWENFLNGRAPLSKNAFSLLTYYLRLRFEEEDEEFSPRVDRFGPLLLAPKSKRVFIEAYNCVTRGGDHDVAYEIVCTNENADYRYVIIESYYTYYVFRLDRTWPSTTALNKNDTLGGESDLLGFEGCIEVKPTFYKQIVKLCDDAVSNPNQSRALLDAFFQPWSEAKGIDDYSIESWWAYPRFVRGRD